MITVESETPQGVSPVVGVILMVAVTVILSAVVGMFVFNLGASTTETSGTQSAVQMETTTKGVTITPVSVGDTLRIQYNDAFVTAVNSSNVGQSIFLPAQSDDTINIFAVSDGKETLVQSQDVEQTPQLGEGLVVYLPLSERDGNTTYEATGRASEGQINGPVHVNDSGIGNSFEFTGEPLSNVSVTGVPVNTSAGATTTVSFWMYSNASATNDMPVGWGPDNYDLWFNAGCFGFNTGQGDVVGVNETLVEGKWVHVTAVFYNGIPSAANNTLYLNGTEQPMSCKDPTDNATTGYVGQRFQVSGWATDSNYEWNGRVDEVRVYNRNLTPAEVATIYEREKDRFEK